MITALGRYVAERPELLHEAASQPELNALTARTAPSLAFYGIALILTLLAPQVAAFGYLATAVLGVLRIRGERAPDERPAAQS